MTCSYEMQSASFKYAICPQQPEVCGLQRDIIVQDFARRVKTSYMYPNQTCSFRMVANSIVKEVIENEVKMYRFIKLKVSVSGGRVKVQGYQIDDTSKVADNFGIFESFK